MCVTMAGFDVERCRASWQAAVPIAGRRCVCTPCDRDPKASGSRGNANSSYHYTPSRRTRAGGSSRSRRCTSKDDSIFFQQPWHTIGTACAICFFAVRFNHCHSGLYGRQHTWRPLIAPSIDITCIKNTCALRDCDSCHTLQQCPLTLQYTPSC